MRIRKISVSHVIDKSRHICMQRAYSRQSQIPEPLPQHTHHRLPNPILQIKPLVLIPLLRTRIPPHGANIHHPIPKLHKRPPLNRYIQIRYIMQDKIHQLFVFRLAQPSDERVCCEWSTEFVGRESVFREAVVEERGYGLVGWDAELFLLLGEVGAADEADGYFLPERGEESEHFWGCFLERREC